MVTCRDVIEETMQGGGAERTFLAGLSGAAPTRSYAVLSDFKVLPPVASPLYPFPFSAPPAWVLGRPDSLLSTQAQCKTLSLWLL